MPIPFQIPNLQGYFPALPPRPDDTDTSQADEQVYPAQRLDLSPEENQQMLMRMFMERLNAQPPPPPKPPDINFMHAMFMSKLGGPLQQVMLQRMMQQQPGYQDYAQKAAGFKAGQEQLGDIGQMLGTMQRTGQSADRMEMYRYLPGQLSYLDPVRGNVNMQVWKDRMTGQIMDEHRNPIDVGALNAQVHFQNYAGPGGENIQATTSPLPQTGVTPLTPQPAQRPSSTGIGHAPGSPAVSGIQGGQAQNVAPAGTAGKGTAHFNPAAAERVAGQSAFAAGLDDLLSYQKRAHQAQTMMFGSSEGVTGIPSLAGQVTADVASQHGYTQPLLQGSPLQAVTDYNVNMRPMLFAYVKQQTGVQFGMKEFSMYASQFPTSLDDENTAIEKLGGLVRSVRQRNIAESEQFKGIEPDKRFTEFSGRTMPRTIWQQLPAAERLRFVVGGGKVM